MWKYILILVLSIIWALKASEDFQDLENYSSTGCNTTITANNSAFALDKHALSKSCFWTIQPNHTGPISLFFSHLFLHENDTLGIYKSMKDAEINKDPLTELIHSQNESLTIITNETTIVLALIGDGFGYDRIFQGYYSVNACSIPVKPDVQILHSPTYLKDTTDKECIYLFNEIPHKRVKQVFSFKEFNMAKSVTIEGGTIGEYMNNMKKDFFITEKVLKLHVHAEVNSSDHFSLKIHEVDKACSGQFPVDQHPPLISPEYVLNNGSIVAECRWLITSQNKILGLKFDKLDFQSVFDIVAVNDGLSEFSDPLLQVTTSNRNSSQNQFIRSSSSSLWISFKPLNYTSRFAMSITEYDQGGYFKDTHDIRLNAPTKDDTVFLLEVEDDKVVELDFDSSEFSPPATVLVYDGFDTSSLLTSLNGQIHFPVISQSSRMMVIGKNFSDNKNSFAGKFKGVDPGCNHMSSLEAENYVLPENCGTTCKWIIPPEVAANRVLVVSLQYVSLQKDDVLKIQKLDANLTDLGEISANETHVPKFIVPANVGAIITVIQAACKEKKDGVVLIGHSSYIPGLQKTPYYYYL